MYLTLYTLKYFEAKNEYVFFFVIIDQIWNIKGLLRFTFDAISPSAAYMRQWIGSALVQIMACRLFGTKPLSKPVLGYYRMDPYEHTSVKFESNTKLFIHEKQLKTSSFERGDGLRNTKISRKFPTINSMTAVDPSTPETGAKWTPKS